MKTREKRNIAFLLVVLIFIHGLPLQPMDVYAQNEQEAWFELSITDNDLIISNATVKVKFLEEWITLTYDHDEEVYKGCYQGNTVSGNLMEQQCDINIVADGYSEIDESVLFTIDEENHFTGKLNIHYYKQLIIQDKFTLKGRVEDMQGLPLSGVNVTIQNAEDNDTYKSVDTGEDGSYEVELVNGSYNIIFVKEDYERVERIFVINGGDLDIGNQSMKKITTYNLTVHIIGDKYGSIEVSSVSGNITPKKLNENIYTYKCKEGDRIKISAFPNENAFLAEKTEKKMISKNAEEGKIDDGSVYYYVIESMNESKEFEVEFEPASHGLVRYEGERVTYCRNGEGGSIALSGNSCSILPDKENHYYVDINNCIRSNENNVVQIARNQFQFLGSGSEFLKVKYKKDEILSQITLSGNGICQEGGHWFWYLDKDETKRLYIELKDSEREVQELSLNFGNVKIDAIKDVNEEGPCYIATIEAEDLKYCKKMYVEGFYREACTNNDCKYCIINEEISIINDDIPPKVESVSINGEETNKFDQDGVTYINTDQAVINAIISDNHNVEKIYYKCYKEKKEPAEIKAEYESGGLQWVGIEEENILSRKEENNNIKFEIKCTIDTSEAATDVWYLYVVAKDRAGNIDFGNEDSKTYFLKLGKDKEPPTVSVNEIGESKSGSNFKKQNDIIGLEGIFKDEHTSNGLKYYVTEPIRINSGQYDSKVWGVLEENAEWICLGKNSNDQTGNGKIKTKNLYISDKHTVSDNGSISGNGLEEGSYIVWLYAKDGCGNVSDGVSYVFHIDDSAPRLNYLGFGEREEGKYLSFGNFFRDKNYNKNNKKIISIEAAGGDEKSVSYFEFDRENGSLKSIRPEIEEIKLFYTKEDNRSINVGGISQNNTLWESKDFITPKSIQAIDNGNKYIFDFEIPEEAVFYSLRAVAKDKAGNFDECDLTTYGNYKSDLIMWDQTSPYLSKSFKPQQGADFKRWYRADSIITYQFETGDKESGLNGVVLKVNGEEVADVLELKSPNLNRMIKELSCSLSIRTKDPYEPEADATMSYHITDAAKDNGEIKCVGKYPVSIASDGHVTISCQATDNAGNPLEQKATESTIYIDQDKPVLTSITFTTNNNRIKDDLAVVPEQYGYFFKKRTEVTVYATDFIGTSQNEMKVLE